MELEYHVYVKTSDVSGGAMDGTVFLTLHGRKNETSEIKLPSDDYCFENGEENEFTVIGADIGSWIKSLTCRWEVNDDVDVDASWHLEAIRVTCDQNGLDQTFVCNDWVNPDAGIVLKSTEDDDEEEEERQEEEERLRKEEEERQSIVKEAEESTKRARREEAERLRLKRLEEAKERRRLEDESYNFNDPSHLVALFAAYCEWELDGTTCGIKFNSFGQLCSDLGLMKGIPEFKQTEFVREQMRRANQINFNGSLSFPEFLRWFLSEVAVILPLSPLGPKIIGKISGLVNLYSLYVHYLSISNSSGFNATAMTQLQFLKLVKECRVIGNQSSSPLAASKRSSVATAMTVGDRKQASHEAGHKVKWLGLFRSLNLIASASKTSEEVALIRASTLGVQRAPAHLRPSASAQVDKGKVLDSIFGLYLGGEVGRSSFVASASEKSREPLSEWQGRDGIERLRMAFNTYNERYNSGVSPASRQDPPWVAAREEVWEDERPAGQTNLYFNSAKRNEKEDISIWENDHPHGLCCCLVRSSTLMEKSSFMKLVNRIPMIQEEMACRTSNLTPERIETAFIMASSVDGDSNDGSSGIHNLGTSSPKSSSPRRAVPLVPTYNSTGPQAGAREYGTPFDLATITASSAERAVTGAGIPGSHRPPAPSLNFISFIEALRLLSVFIVGNDPIEVAALVKRKWWRRVKGFRLDTAGLVTWQIVLEHLLSDMKIDAHALDTIKGPYE